MFRLNKYYFSVIWYVSEPAIHACHQSGFYIKLIFNNNNNSFSEEISDIFRLPEEQPKLLLALRFGGFFFLTYSTFKILNKQIGEPKNLVNLKQIS